MSEITANPIVRVGVDLAKRVIQVHGVDAAGKTVVNRALARDKFLPWCSQLPAGCVVAMEACAGAHHWARELTSRGLDAKIIPAALAVHYRVQGKGGKNDANDAAAVCEAASRPNMHFALPKSAQQQGMLCVHRLREGYKAERTACVNRIRGLLAEFGLVFAPKAHGISRGYCANACPMPWKMPATPCRAWPAWPSSRPTATGRNSMPRWPGATNALPPTSKMTSKPGRLCGSWAWGR